MIADLEGLGPLAARMGEAARGAGVRLVWRAQSRRLRRAVVRDGRAENVSESSSSGHGVQVFTEEGRTALGSRDDFEPEAALGLLERVAGAAKAGRELGTARVDVPDLAPLVAREVPSTVVEFDRIDLGAVARRLAELEAEIAGRVRGVRLAIAYAADLDAWRVFRSDGTDVLFAMPRCTLRLGATTAREGERHSVAAVVSGPDPRLPWIEADVQRLFKRAESAARLAAALPDAPFHPAGSYPFVIDYALAKGLAHEAFGHASEADGYRSSALASEGKLRRGEIVGAPHVSIVDEPIAGDHAWQPFSANGLRRERAVLVEHGRVAEGLADPWSARAGGVAITDAARAESFRDAPLPRMSNIRIEVDAPLPAPGAFEDYGPQEVRDLLARTGVFERHREVVYLSGYGGGQVAAATGDFVFNCNAIYGLSADRITFCKPAIFAGSMFAALRAVREAFGPLLLDAVGRCGKAGQGVPSSGGSHYFLVLDPDPAVRLGGS